jgi:hypothetical protein
MMNTNLRALLVFIILTYCRVIVAGTAPNAAFDTLTGDFGTVKQGQIITQKFTVANKGDALLMIEKIQFSMPGMKAKVKQEIPPGQSADMKIEWDTSRFTQQVKGQAMLFLNDKKQPKVVLTLTGTVTAPLDILPYPAVYLSQFAGERESRSVTIKNNQEHKFSITKLEPQGKNFSAGLKVLEPGKEYRIDVTVPPGTAIGRYREALILHTDDKAYPRLNIEMNILVKPDVFVTPETLDFGRINLTQVKSNSSLLNLLEQDFLVKRKTGDMTIKGISADFPFLKLTQDPIGKAQNFQVNVGLAQDKLKPGKFSGSIILETDDPKFSKLAIPVSGEIIE